MITFYLAEKNNARDIARIHKQEIGKGFLSSLPLVFLGKLYLSIIENDFCVVAKENNEVIGFIAGTRDLKKLYTYFLKRYFFYSIIFLAPKIFSIKKIMETLFYPKDENIKAELLTIAVKSDFQGKGVATEILEVFAKEMRNRNVERFKVMVGGELFGAIKFYEKNGFKFLKEIEVHKGRKSKVYTFEL